jgi:hypothetical protein
VLIAVPIPIGFLVENRLLAGGLAHALHVGGCSPKGRTASTTGSGKSMLSKRIATIMPSMTIEEAIDGGAQCGGLLMGRFRHGAPVPPHHNRTFQRLAFTFAKRRSVPSSEETRNLVKAVSFAGMKCREGW